MGPTQSKSYMLNIKLKYFQPYVMVLKFKKLHTKANFCKGGHTSLFHSQAVAIVRSRLSFKDYVHLSRIRPTIYSQISTNPVDFLYE